VYLAPLVVLLSRVSRSIALFLRAVHVRLLPHSRERRAVVLVLEFKVRQQFDEHEIRITSILGGRAVDHVAQRVGHHTEMLNRQRHEQPADRPPP
jgi:hypothetical protein